MAKEQTSEEMLIEYVENVVKQDPRSFVAGFCPDCEEFVYDETCPEDDEHEVSYDSLDVRYTITSTGNLHAVEFLTACGGPNIWVKITDGYMVVNGYWSFDHVQRDKPISDSVSGEILDIFDDLVKGLMN